MSKIGNKRADTCTAFWLCTAVCTYVSRIVLFKFIFSELLHILHIFIDNQIVQIFCRCAGHIDYAEFYSFK